MSGNTSFNSISSGDGKHRSKFTTLHEAGGDFDGTIDELSTTVDFPDTIKQNNHSKSFDQRYATPPRTRSNTSIFRDFYHSPDTTRATHEIPKSTPTFPSLPSGLSTFLSPKSAESTSSRTLAHIAGMFSFRRSFDSQVSDSQSSIENIEDIDKGRKSKEDIVKE